MRPIFRHWYGRHKILCWVTAGIIILYTLTGFVITPLIVEHALRNKVSGLIDRSIQVQSVRTNPYTFSIRLVKLSISDRNEGQFVQAGEIYANVDPLISLFKWGVVVKSVAISNPQVRIVRYADGQFNFSDMMAQQDKRAVPEAEAPVEPMRLILKAFNLVDGEVRFTDTLESEPFESTLSAVTVRLDRLDTHPDAVAAPYLMSVRSEANERIEITGAVDLQPMTLSADVRLDDLLISKYAPYYREMVHAPVTEGRIALNTVLTWSDTATSLDDIQFTLSQLHMESGPNKPMIAVPRLEVTGASIDLRAHTVQLGTISTRDGRLDIAMDGKGQLNLAAAFASSADNASPAQTPSNVEPDDASAWSVTVPTFTLENYTVRYMDQQTDPAADMMVRQLRVDAKGLSNRKDESGKVDIALNWTDQGTVTLRGDVGLVPLQAHMAVQVKGLDVRPVQPYISKHLQLVVTRGFLDSKGDLKVETRTAESPDIQYAGQVAMNQFKSVDRRNTTDFLNWKSLYLSGVEFASTPLKLTVNEVALTDFYNRLIINKDGSSNLAMIMGGDKAAKPGPGNPTEQTPKATQTNSKEVGPEIKINSVTLQGGRVDFSDLFVKPNVQLPMAQIGGRVSGLDAIKTHKADVLLKGKVGGNVPMEIKGQINPLIENPFVDITIGLRGVDLSPFTPYSGKYLGYKLDKGQLSLDLAYRLADNKLAGQNKVLLNQLTLGETVESPTATKLPIKLALALLKDRQGNIDLDLPVAGNLEDPEFSIGGIVVKMFVNLIVGIVSSPFKALGALFGGGEELAYLDFDYGYSLIADGKSEKLDTLAKILYERPALKLEIQGQVQPKEDIDGLRRLRFDAQLKAAKLKKMVSKGTKAIPPEQIELTREERDGLVRKAYKAAKFPKPRDDKGAIKKLGPAEMEKLLYTAIEITADDLRLLAHQRASAAKAYLAEQGSVEVERLFIVEPEVEANEEKEEMRSRVKFNLI